MTVSIDYVGEVLQASTEWKPDDDQVLVNLGIGGYHQNKIPREARHAIKVAVNNDWLSEYSDAKGLDGPCSSLVSNHQRTLDLDLGGFDSSMTEGGRDALFKLMKTLVSPGDEVFLPMPGYGGQLLAVLEAGGIPVPIRCGPGFNYAAGAREKVRQGHKPVVILFDRIHNPTGETMTKGQLEDLSDLAAEPQVNAYLVEDGVYGDMVLEGDAVPSMLMIQRAHGRLFVIASGSKHYGLAGLRIGGIVAPAFLIAKLVDKKKIFNYGPNVLAQLAYEVCLNECDYYIERKKNEIRLRRDVVCATFTQLGWRIRPVKAGIFIFTAIPRGEEDALTLSKDAASQAGWIWYPGRAYAFGEDVSEFDRMVRIALMEPVRKMQTGLPSLSAFAENRPWFNREAELSSSLLVRQPCTL